jgi:phosphatidate cytidylyltransferase
MMRICSEVHDMPNGSGLQFFFTMCLWNADNGGIVFGSWCGRQKMLPAVSPGKSWAGFIGGIGLCALTALLFHYVQHPTYGVGWLPPHFLPVEWSVLEVLTIGVGLGVVGTIGDLAESLLKRAAGVKDSGAFFPGHGGCFDRMDSMLLAVPCFYHFVVQQHTQQQSA